MVEDMNSPIECEVFHFSNSPKTNKSATKQNRRCMCPFRTRLCIRLSLMSSLHSTEQCLSTNSIQHSLPRRAKWNNRDHNMLKFFIPTDMFDRKERSIRMFIEVLEKMHSDDRDDDEVLDLRPSLAETDVQKRLSVPLTDEFAVPRGTVSLNVLYTETLSIKTYGKLKKYLHSAQTQRKQIQRRRQSQFHGVIECEVVKYEGNGARALSKYCQWLFCCCWITLFIDCRSIRPWPHQEDKSRLVARNSQFVCHPWLKLDVA